MGAASRFKVKKYINRRCEIRGSVLSHSVEWMLTKSGDMLLGAPSQERQNTAPKADVQVRMLAIMFAPIRVVPSSVLAISIAGCPNLGCVSGATPPNVGILKKYQYASWVRFFRVRAFLVPKFAILSDRLMTIV
jgi:hypothetical protein